ncbi:MAG: vitamin B12 dependent-methionine synthase activation domain-containing protein [Bdellovibrionales bacterium]
MDVESEIGIRLTESCAMDPPSSVSGFYFGSPQSKYFTVGKIMKDQVAALAKTSKQDFTDVERWLQPNLGY